MALGPGVLIVGRLRQQCAFSSMSNTHDWNENRTVQDIATGLDGAAGMAGAIARAATAARPTFVAAVAADSSLEGIRTGPTRGQSAWIC